MDNIVQFKQRVKNEEDHSVRWMISLNIYEHENGELDVHAEIGDDHTDYDIFEAIMAAAWKYAEDSDLVEDVEDDND